MARRWLRPALVAAGACCSDRRIPPAARGERLENRRAAVAPAICIMKSSLRTESTVLVCADQTHRCSD